MSRDRRSALSATTTAKPPAAAASTSRARPARPNSDAPERARSEKIAATRQPRLSA
jgi:hypothetical protein